MPSPPNGLLSAVLSHFDRTDFIEVAVIFVVVGLFWLIPLLLDPWFSAFERAATHVAHRKRAAVLAIALGVILVRLAALPLLPIPFPQVHDEFSYLLAGDTFAHARLANPPHPMWLFFDTIHVNQHPMYMSKYPPAQGAALALGEILGNPWIGVLLSCAAMCAAFVWSLRGWLPDSWALVGAALFALHIGIFSYWMNSYWGGAVAATGGALVIGAYPRILQTWKVRDAALLGMGAAILALSRPFEGLIFCIPVALGLLIAMWKKRRAIWPGVLLKAAACLGAIGIMLGAFQCYYNFRGTGHAFLSPYTLNQRQYLITPVLGWGTPAPPFRHTSPQLDAFYNGWARESWLQGRWKGWWSFPGVSLGNARWLAHFFVWPELCLTIPTLLLSFRYKRFRFLFLQLALCIGAFALVPWFQPHYAAPMACSLFVVLAEGLRLLRHFRARGNPIGVGLSRAVLLLAIVFAPFHLRFPPVSLEMVYRGQFVRKLSAEAGQHLVVVRYSGRHDPLAEWVYNAAEIDQAKVVWAREIPGVDLQPLFNYFHGRTVWLAEPDADPPRLTPFQNSPPQNR